MSIRPQNETQHHFPPSIRQENHSSGQFSHSLDPFPTSALSAYAAIPHCFYDDKRSALAQAKARIVELERLVGRQQMDSDCRLNSI